SRSFMAATFKYAKYTRVNLDHFNYQNKLEFMLFGISLLDMGYTTIHGHPIQGEGCKVVVNDQYHMQRSGSDNATISRIDLIVVKKIIGYVLIFLLTWTPSVVFFITQMFQYENIWIYTATVISINLGGLGNAILYISYESWKNRYDNGNISIKSNSSAVSESSQESHPQTTQKQSRTTSSNNSL
ncbi:24699_t:CDS:2, partial [Racocetra persica]